METGLMVLLARGFARESGIEIKTGKEAGTDCKKNIWLPPLSPDNKRANALALRWLLHETAHINYTSPEVIEGADGCRNILNALEDIRVEWEKCKELPGAAQRLSEGILALKEAGRIGLRDEDSPAVVLHKFLLYKLRADLLGQPLAEEGELVEKRLAELVGSAKVQKVKAVGRSVLLCTNTRDVLNLAKRIVTVLQEEENKPSEPTEGNPNPGSGAEDGHGSGAANTAPDTSPADTQNQQKGEGTQQGDSPVPDPQAAEGEASQQDGEGTQQGANSPEPDQDTVKENVRLILQGMSADEEARASLEEAAKEEINLAAKNTDRQPGSYAPGTDEYRDPVPGDGASLMDAAKKASAALREAFETFIQTKTLAHRYNTRRGRRLDSRKLFRLHSANPSVFVQQAEGEKIDTSVHLAVDISGSMDGRPLQVAKEAAMAVALALEGIEDVDLTITAFGSYLYTLKEREDNVITASRNLDGVQDGGGTALVEAILDGADRLLASRRPGKVLLVATDGEVWPSEKVAEMVNRIRSMGVVSHGIGICADIRHVFGDDHSVVIQDVDELAPALFQLLQRSLFVQQAAA